MLNRDVLESEPLVNILNIQLYDDGHIYSLCFVVKSACQLYVLKPLNTDS